MRLTQDPGLLRAKELILFLAWPEDSTGGLPAENLRQNLGHWFPSSAQLRSSSCHVRGVDTSGLHVTGTSGRGSQRGKRAPEVERQVLQA